MGIIDPIGGLVSPQNEDQKYLISTPAGGKFLIGDSELSSILERNAQSVWRSCLYRVFAKKVGDKEAREHFISIDVCDISSYFEPAPETEPVGCATAEQKPSGERPDDHFDGSFEVGG